MKNPLVRKFQPNPPPAAQDAPPATDFDIPEINTNFIDNLFTDPTFVDRFDVAFGPTEPMGLDGEVKPSASRPGTEGASEEWPDMLDISFSKKPTD